MIARALQRLAFVSREIFFFRKGKAGVATHTCTRVVYIVCVSIIARLPSLTRLLVAPVLHGIQGVTLRTRTALSLAVDDAIFAGRGEPAIANAAL